jgi:hypothetical protein
MAAKMDKPGKKRSKDVGTASGKASKKAAAAGLPVMKTNAATPMPPEELNAFITKSFLEKCQPMLDRDVRRLSLHHEIYASDRPFLLSTPQDFRDWIAASGAKTVDREVDFDAFDAWWAENDYETRFPVYSETYPNALGRKYKAFEHWISLRETADAPSGPLGAVSVDVACATSPFHEVCAGETGGICYRQDLALPEYGYKPGVNGNVIGSSADAIPLDTGSVDRVVSHNAVEHFEGLAYEMFYAEAMRLLRPGGILYVCPLFASRQTFSYVALTGIYRRLSMPNLSVAERLVYSDRIGQPYGLLIGPDRFRSRILGRMKAYADVEIVYYPNNRHRESGFSFEMAVRAVRNNVPFA